MGIFHSYVKLPEGNSHDLTQFWIHAQEIVLSSSRGTPGRGPHGRPQHSKRRVSSGWFWGVPFEQSWEIPSQSRPTFRTLERLRGILRTGTGPRESTWKSSEKYIKFVQLPLISTRFFIDSPFRGSKLDQPPGIQRICLILSTRNRHDSGAWRWPHLDELMMFQTCQGFPRVEHGTAMWSIFTELAVVSQHGEELPGKTCKRLANSERTCIANTKR